MNSLKRYPLFFIVILYIGAILIFYPRAPYPEVSSQKAELSGTLQREPTWYQNKKGVTVSRFILKTEKGQLLVRAYGGIVDLYSGDKVKVIGRIKRDLNTSIKNIELISRAERNFIVQALQGFKLRFKGIINYYLPPAEAGFTQGILLGERSGISLETRQVFAETGTIHILAISGLHVGIIATILYFLLKLCGLKRISRSLLIIIFLTCYAFITGSRAPVVRATIMASVYLIGLMMERENNSLNTLSLAALVILLINPQELFQIGFQLSFITVLTIVTLAPRLPGRYFAVSLAAWLGSAPLVAGYFGIISPVAILANLVVIPLLSLVILVSLIFLIFHPIFTGLLINLERVLFATVGWFHRIPGGYFKINNFPLLAIVAWYIIIFGFGAKKTK